MAHFRKIGSSDVAGYDESRSLQVLPALQQTSLYLVAGEGLDVSVDDPDRVTVKAEGNDNKSVHKSAELTPWEKDQVIRKVILVAKTGDGQTALRAKLNGSDWVKPITIQLVSDQNWRGVGKAQGEVSRELRQELQRLDLRDAVLRIAEDQMHSSIASRSDGFGVYDCDPSYNWCGAFAHWCWKQAAAIKAVQNPFGANNDVLLSPQKAISWAMRVDTPLQLLRYQGGNPMTGKGTQEYREIGYNGCFLERGDIVLLREGNAGGWKHVCMINSVNGSQLQTMDGNQGKGQSIKLVTRSLDDKVTDGSPKLVFVHVIL